MGHPCITLENRVLAVHTHLWTWSLPMQTHVMSWRRSRCVLFIALLTKANADLSTHQSLQGEWFSWPAAPLWSYSCQSSFVFWWTINHSFSFLQDAGIFFFFYKGCGEDVHLIASNPTCEHALHTNMISFSISAYFSLYSRTRIYTLVHM